MRYNVTKDGDDYFIHLIQYRSMTKNKLNLPDDIVEKTAQSSVRVTQLIEHTGISASADRDHADAQTLLVMGFVR